MEKRALGSCLCGATRFRIDGPFEHFYLCHCSRCRKDSGSAHAANLFSSTATIIWEAGQEHVRVFRLEGTRHVRSFCGLCGSALPTRDAGTALLLVPAGSLDSDIGLRPDARIFYADRATWDEGPDATDAPCALTTFDGLPH